MRNEEDTFHDQLDLQNEFISSSTAWYYSNPNVNDSTFSSDYSVNAIMSEGPLSTGLGLYNESFNCSSSPSDFASNDSLHLSTFEQIPLKSSITQQNFSVTSDSEMSDISFQSLFYNNNNNQNIPTSNNYNADKHNCIPSMNVNNISSIYSNSDSSYVIVDKNIFELLLHRSHILNETSSKKNFENISFNFFTSNNHLSQNYINENCDKISSSYENGFNVNSDNMEDNVLINKLDPNYYHQTFDTESTKNIQSFYLAVLEGRNTFKPKSTSETRNQLFTDDSPPPFVLKTYPTLPFAHSYKKSVPEGHWIQKVDTIDIKDFKIEGHTDLCLVCGDTASCQHYAVKSCEGCKGFFKRTIQKNTSHTYICLQNSACIIDKQNRNRCQYCRFQKCVKVGMVKEIVRKESLKGRRGRLSSKVKMKNNGSQSPYTVVNLLSTIDSAVNFTEPKCIEKDYLALEKLHKKMEHEDIIVFVLNEFHESMKMVKQFSEKLIGFSTLSKRDQNLIMLLNGFEFLTLRSALRHVSGSLDKLKLLKGSLDGCIVLDNSCILTKHLLSRSIFNEWSKETAQLSSELHVLQKCNQEIINGLLVVTLLKIEIDSEESKLLEDASLVYSLRHRYVEVLKTYCGSKSSLESPIKSSKKTKLNHITQSFNSLNASNILPDSKLLSKLLDKQTMVQSIVKESLLKPIINHYFGTNNIQECDKVISNLILGQEILTFCPKWLFKLVMYKSMPHLCKH